VTDKAADNSYLNGNLSAVDVDELSEFGPSLFIFAESATVVGVFSV